MKRWKKPGSRRFAGRAVNHFWRGFNGLLERFDAHRDAHAAANAQRGEALRGLAALQFEDKRVEDAGTGRTDRVADGNRAAIDVDLVRVKTEIAGHSAGLSGEGFVCFDEIQIASRPARLFERLARGGNGANAHNLRIDTSGCPGGDAGERGQATAQGFGFRHQHHGRRAIIDAGCIAGGHRTLLVEGRLQLGERFKRGAGANIFVLIDDNIALARGDGEGNNFVGKATGLLGGFGLLLRTGGKGILLVTGQLSLTGDVFRRNPHVITVEGVRQAILQHGVHEFDRTHARTGTKMLAVRC